MKDKSEIFRVLDFYGIPWMVDPEYSQEVHPTWDGEVLRIPPWESPDWIMHEISHFLVATPQGRKDPNWGLGPDPGGGAKTQATGNHRGASPKHDESSACLLDLWLLRVHGFEDLVEKHMDNYQIFDFSESELGFCGEILLQAGLPAGEIIQNWRDLEVLLEELSP